MNKNVPPSSGAQLERGEGFAARQQRSVEIIWGMFRNPCSSFTVLQPQQSLPMAPDEVWGWLSQRTRLPQGLPEPSPLWCQAPHKTLVFYKIHPRAHRNTARCRKLTPPCGSQVLNSSRVGRSRLVQDNLGTATARAAPQSLPGGGNKSPGSATGGTSCAKGRAEGCRARPPPYPTAG